MLRFLQFTREFSIDPIEKARRRYVVVIQNNPVTQATHILIDLSTRRVMKNKQVLGAAISFIRLVWITILLKTPIPVLSEDV
jgi:hypothetical protein